MKHVAAPVFGNSVFSFWGTPSSAVEGSSQTAASAARQSRHQRGVCDPCVFFTTSLGCVRGKDCRYCHLPHPDSDAKTVNRPRKQTRDKYKAAIQEILQKNAGRLHEIHDDLQWEARKNTYIRKVLQGYLDNGLGLDGVPLPPPRPFATPDVGNFESPKLLATSPPIALGTGGIDVGGSGYASIARAHLWHEAARDVPSESEESQTNYTETQKENKSRTMTHPAESSSSALGSLIAIAQSSALRAPTESIPLRTADLQWKPGLDNDIRRVTCFALLPVLSKIFSKACSVPFCILNRAESLSSEYYRWWFHTLFFNFTPNLGENSHFDPFWLKEFWNGQITNTA